MYKYEIIIYWDETDQTYIAEVPELPGCFAHGASYDEALNNVKDASEFGDPIPEPKGERLMFA